MKIFISLFILLFVYTTDLFAQKTVAAAGHSEETADYQVSWTLGDLVIITADTDNTILTQGFQQPSLTVNPQTSIQVTGIELKVFPNPTADFVNIHFSEFENNASFAVYNQNGSLVEQREITSSQTQVNFTSLASGQYILRITRNKTQPLQSFKIVKR